MNADHPTITITHETAEGERAWNEMLHQQHQWRERRRKNPEAVAREEDAKLQRLADYFNSRNQA